MNDEAAWEEALRALEKHGDPTMLAAHLWWSDPDEKGKMSIPAAVVYELARLVAPKDRRERAKLVRETISRREQIAAMQHESIVHEMLDLIKSGEKIGDAAANAAKKLGTSKRTALVAWKRARVVPFVNNIAKRRKNEV